MPLSCCPKHVACIICHHQVARSIEAITPVCQMLWLGQTLHPQLHNSAAARHTQMPCAQQAASLHKHITGCVPPQASKALPYRACARQATDKVVYTIVGWNHKCTTGCACVKEATCLQQSYQRKAWQALVLFLCIREKTHPPDPCKSKPMQNQTATHHAILCIKLGIASLQQYCTGSQNHPSAKP
jgi:hypothetical protein